MISILGRRSATTDMALTPIIVTALAADGISADGTAMNLKIALAMLLLTLHMMRKLMPPFGKGCSLLRDAFAQFVGMVIYDGWRLFWRIVAWPFRAVWRLFR